MKQASARNGYWAWRWACLLYFLWPPVSAAAQEKPSAQLPELKSLYKALQTRVFDVPVSSAVPALNALETALRQKTIGPAAGLTSIERLSDNIPAGHALQLLDLLTPDIQSNPDNNFQYYYLRAMLLNRLEETDSALVVCQKLNAVANADPLRKAWAVLAEAKIRHAQLQFQTTYRLAGIALDHARRNGDKRLEALALSTIGRVSRDIYMAMPERSAPYHEQALAVARTLGDSALVIEELTALSLNYIGTEQPALAQQYLEEALRWFGPQSTLRSRYVIVRQMAFFWDQYGDPVQSYRLYEAAVSLAKQLGLRSSTQNLYEQMSGICMQQGNADQAQACLDSAARHSTYKRELGYFYRGFAEVAAMRGDTALAFSWYQKAFGEQVKGYNDRNTLQLTEWETQFRTREKEIQLEDQKRQRWLLFGLVVTLALLFTGVAIAFFQQKKSRRILADQNAIIEKQAVELRRLDESKSRFFANVSHELRTPLTLMLAPLGSMLKGNRLDGRDIVLARTARQHGKQLLNLVNEILDLSKIESGKMQLQETTVLLQPFLRRVVSAFESHAERLGIRFVFEYRVEERLRLQLDADKWQKVANNLLSNALKFTPPNAGGVVSVRVVEAGNYIRFSVHDTGRGIHPDDLPHIFDRFFQTGQANAPIEGGTGIGLALCREFAELMQGKIWAESTLGSGSSFYFETPKKEVLGVAHDELQGLDIEPEPQNDEYTLRAANLGIPRPESITPHLPTILLVEDNESLRDYLTLILIGKYNIVTAENGQAACAILDDKPAKENEIARHTVRPDLIISDVMMPVMDGFQLVEKLKSDNRWRHIPVVMLTARADLRDKLKALRIGVDDYLLKPFEEEELFTRVENLLKNARARLLAIKNPDDERALPGNAPPGLSDRKPGPVANITINLESVTRMPLQGPGDSVPIPAASAFQQLSPEEMAWLGALEKTVEQATGSAHFNAELLAKTMFMSRTKLFQQIKRLTGMTPNEYVLEVRFRTARTLLENRSAGSVKSVAGTVGFRDVEYFSKQFRARFGKAPSEYLSS